MGKTDGLHVDADTIRRFAIWIKQKADDLTPIATSCNDIDVFPGSEELFPHAKQLRETVLLQRGRLGQNIANLQQALRDIGDDLLIIANKYRRTEELNKLDAAALDKLIKDVGQDLSAGGSGGR